ncbi:DUF1456 family protein [Pelagicoccus sp. SDUM812002]|uniref:DUF1456 family protein n=1 Tax=Pelagicoccus sp. SDUM812002 TaxID=3041266 RepID=UPI00281077C7|nr:DUF1456 family protein [Pelagicoccus sp. SDUM812002]MDQ8187087.1 DUF1456 family protein [Pelagicoccus sp. SDUM812002]
MTNNDVMRSVRYALDLKNAEVVQMIKEGGVELTALDVSNILKDETDEGYVACSIETIHAFLDGLILSRRGPSDRPVDEEANTWINNTVVLRKLRIAFSMKDTDMIATMKAAGFQVSKGEINALFRATNHKHYKKCGDQFLRNFLKGLALTFRPPEDPWANSRASG